MPRRAYGVNGIRAYTVELVPLTANRRTWPGLLRPEENKELSSRIRCPSLISHLSSRGRRGCLVVWLSECANNTSNREGPRGGFIPAETIVQNATAGDNDTGDGTLNHSVLGFLVG